VSLHPRRLAPALNITIIVEYHNRLEKASVLLPGKELLPEMTGPNQRTLGKRVDSAGKFGYHWAIKG